MNYKQKLGYTVLGAVIMLVGLGLGTIVSPPLIAQRNGVFDEIECSKLTVVDKSGERAIDLSTNPLGRSITVYDTSGKPAVDLTAHGAAYGMTIGNTVTLYDREGKQRVGLLADEESSIVYLKDKSGNTGVGLASEEDNVITVYDKLSKPVVTLHSADIMGNGMLIMDKAGSTAIQLESGTTYGNSISVWDKAGQISWSTP